MTDKKDKKPNPVPAPGRSAERRQSDDERIDEASKESFPTSDPPSFMPGHAGAPRHADDK